ncbi:hypothetical protein [Sphingobium sufflavum]|uniref:hypothetical protein n=1 Tax=Sphingobium sufflavum TaxID=1129547 RepID=UPI001F376348|nr:hypothetical protein [Sphingobium sufflavum]
MTGRELKTGKKTREAVVVLGMHRTGTSALSRVLSLLGCDLPATLLDDNPTNPRGHWESAAIVGLNEAVLASVGSVWNDWRPMCSSWRESVASLGYKARAVDVLRAEYGDSALFVLKDPRNCRLAPFWLDVLESEQVTPHIVITLRNPLEVAESLHLRDSFYPELGQLLWLRHVLDAEYASRGRSRLFSTYSELLDDWSRLISRMEIDFGLSWPIDKTDASVEIGRFLDPIERHHVRSTQAVLANPEVSEWLRLTYAIMLEWAVRGENPEDYQRLDDIRSQFDGAAPAFARLIQAGGEDLQRVHGLEGNLADKELQLQGLTHELQALRSHHEAAIEQSALRIHDLEGSLSLKTQENDQQAARGAELEADFVRVSTEVADLRHAIATAESTLRQRQEELEQLWAELAADRVAAADLKVELAEVSGRLSLTSEKLVDANGWVFQLAGERRALEQWQALANQKLLEADRKLAAADISIALARDEAAAVRHAAEVIRSQAIITLNEAEAVKEQSASALADGQAARAEVLRLEGKLSVALSEHARAQQALAEGQSALHAAEERAAGLEEKFTSSTENLQERFAELAIVARFLREREEDVAVAASKSEWLRRVSALLMNRPRWWAFVPHKLQQRWTYGRLMRRGLFDAQAYVALNPDVGYSGVDPLKHYMMHGMAEGRPVNESGIR